MGPTDDGPLDFRVWCGGLHSDITTEEVERKFEKFGKILHVKVRSSARDTFAFVQFNDDEAVEEAIRKMDGNTSLGDQVKVQRATKGRGEPRPRRSPPRSRRRDDSRSPPRRGGGGRGRGRDRSESRGRTPPRRGGRNRSASFSPGRAPRRGGRAGRSRSPRRSPKRSPRRSPPPRSGARSAGRSETKEEGVLRMAGKLPVGRYKITVENIPEDMTWMELKALAHDFGPTLTFARTYRANGTYCGMLEFKDHDDAERTVKELDRRRVQGSKERLKAFHGGEGGDR